MAAGRKSFGALGIGVAFVVGALTFFIVLAAMRHLFPADVERLTPVSQRLPGDITMPTLADKPDAKPWTLSDQRGRVVLVNYFATWCGPCREEMGALTALARQYEGRVVFVGISLDHDNEGGQGITRQTPLQEFVQKYDVPYAILLPDPNATIMRNSSPIPQTVLYDKEGRQALHTLGAINKGSIARALDELLKE